jgi:hypothetical protein
MTAQQGESTGRRRPTAYVRLSARLPVHPDLTGLPSDSARWCWVVILCEAKLQPEPGVFRSLAHLRSVVGWRLARTLPALFAAGLLERPGTGSSDGPVEVHNWSRWQSLSRPDLTQADRSRRYRQRQKAKRHGSVTGVTAQLPVTTVTGDPPLQGYRNALVTGPVGAAPVTVLESLKAGGLDPALLARFAARQAGDAKADPMVDCKDYTAHQLSHRKVDGTWRCGECDSARDAAQ